MSKTQAKVPIVRLQVGAVALMFGLSTMSYFDRTIMSIAGPEIMKDFGISETGMGTVFSAFLISYAIFMAPGGRLADRFGPRKVLFLGGMGAALFTGLTGLTGGAWLGASFGVVASLLIIRFLFGICTAPLYPALGRMTAAWFPAAQVARVQAIVITGAPLGGAISPVMFAALIGAFGWRWSFGWAAIATALLGGVWYWYARDDPREYGVEIPGVSAPGPVREGRFPWGTLLGDRNLLLLTAGYFCMNYFQYIFYYWIYYYFGEIRGMSRGDSATYVTFLMLTITVMTPLGGWVADAFSPRLGSHGARRLVSVTGLSLSAVLLYVGSSGLDIVPTVVFLSLAAGCNSMAEGPFWATAIETGGKNAGVAGGIMNCGGNIGGILSPTLTPIIAGYVGWEGSLHFASFVVMLSMVVWFFIKPNSASIGATL
ncbi:MAG: MFS transporter [Acidobacteria bacterium]|nr:MFS transporter [Acidobacteriota bacterium]